MDPLDEDKLSDLMNRKVRLQIKKGRRKLVLKVTPPPCVHVYV